MAEVIKKSRGNARVDRAAAILRHGGESSRYSIRRAVTMSGSMVRRASIFRSAVSSRKCVGDVHEYHTSGQPRFRQRRELAGSSGCVWVSLTCSRTTNGTATRIRTASRNWVAGIFTVRSVANQSETRSPLGSWVLNLSDSSHSLLDIAMTVRIEIYLGSGCRGLVV